MSKNQNTNTTSITNNSDDSNINTDDANANNSTEKQNPNNQAQTNSTINKHKPSVPSKPTFAAAVQEAIAAKKTHATAINIEHGTHLGRDTTSAALTWFFVLLAKNPSVEKKIRQEIQQQLHVKEDENLKLFTKEESRKLIYLHGSLCETLRLFPSLPLEHKVPLDHDILPSGHHVSPHTRMILPFYSMGRMETLWGKDYLEFKPERWISDRGGIKHEPSFKFPAFNVGPRTCIGKEMTFFQMKIVAATIIHNYHIQVVEPNNVSPTTSISCK
ncbi:hypothetical protein P3L10_034301 [Capsicum annuum]